MRKYRSLLAPGRQPKPTPSRRANLVEYGSGPRALPEGALIWSYRDQGCYTDCFTADVPGAVSHAHFVEAFYTSSLFTLERTIIKWAVRKPSTDEEARQLANGALDRFSAWTVDARAENQLLVRDYQGRTLSWLMASPLNLDGMAATRLCFGTVVVARPNPRNGGAPTVPLIFRLLVLPHRLYAKALLRSAISRLGRQSRSG